MKISNFAKKGLAVAMFAAAAGISSGAYADAAINPYFTVPPPDPNVLEDTNLDRICDGVCDGTNTLKSGTFEVGMYIESLLRFSNVNTSLISDLITPDGSLPSGYKLFAYSSLEITAIAEATGNTLGDDASLIGNGACDAGEICLAYTDPYVAVYETTTVPTNWRTLNPDGAGGSIDLVNDGTLILELGLVEADDFWFFNFIGGSDPIGAIADLTGADNQQGAYQFGISATNNPGNIPFQANGILGADGNYHDFRGNGSAYQLAANDCGGAQATCGVDGWVLGTNTTVEFVTAVPEPGSLALLGMGLAAASWFGGRRRKA